MKRKRTGSDAHVSASLYGGDFDINFECPGEDKCRQAMFYTDPPEADAECVKRRGFACTHPHAIRAALGDLRKKIDEKLKEYGNDEGV